MNVNVCWCLCVFVDVFGSKSIFVCFAVSVCLCKYAFVCFF